MGDGGVFGESNAASNRADYQSSAFHRRAPRRKIRLRTLPFYFVFPERMAQIARAWDFVYIRISGAEGLGEREFQLRSRRSVEILVPPGLQRRKFEYTRNPKLVRFAPFSRGKQSRMGAFEAESSSEGRDGGTPNSDNRRGCWRHWTRRIHRRLPLADQAVRTARAFRQELRKVRGAGCAGSHHSQRRILCDFERSNAQG